MLRVGFGRPGIVEYFPDLHSHDRTPMYSLNDWYWVSLDKYEDIQRFQEFNMEKFYSKNTSTWELCRIKSELERLFKMSGGYQLWQMNFTQDFNDYYRHVIKMGEVSLIRWSWFDAYIIKYLYCPLLWWKNLTRRKGSHE